MRRGRPARYDSEYVRHGTANLLIAFAPLSGQRVVKLTERRCRGDFAQFVRDLVDGPYHERAADRDGAHIGRDALRELRE